jgi:hypothetical protein
MSGFRGWGGLLTFSLGAAPGSLRPVGTSSTAERSSSDDVEPCLPTEGVADKGKATDDSQEFLNNIKKEIEAQGLEKWDDFAHLKQHR